MATPFTYSNTSTYNLENVLRQNILKSDYYNKTCLELTTWEEVVDEIYDNVTHVEPWMSGNARGPSTAFCLLHRLLTLNLTVRQIRELIDHKDSPYIRAVGFLFLRYVAEAKVLWQWCTKYVDDRESFAPSPEAGNVTMGDYVRDLLLEQYYFETIFPRIPKLVMDSMVEELKGRKLPHTGKGNGGTGGPDRRGVEGDNKRPASVKASLSVAMGQRAPNRAGAREDRGALADKSKPSSRPPPPRSPDERKRSRSPLPPRNDSSRDRVRDDRDRVRDDRDRVRDDRDRVRDDRDRARSSRGDSRDRGRDRRADDDSRRGPGGSSRYDERDRVRDDRERRRDDERDRERPRYDREDRSRRENERGADRQRERDRDERDRRRSRSREALREEARRRSRSGSRSRDRGGRDARDVFREPASRAGGTDVDAIRAKYL